MPTFDTPEPISVTLELVVGDIRIVASHRTDTIVAVQPSDPAKSGDVTAAQQTRVEFAGGQLLIKAPKGWRQFSFRGGAESITVQINLPTGSHVHGGAAVAALHTAGRLGECTFKTSAGDIHVAESGPLQLKTGGGDITVEQADGDVEVITGTGAVRIDRVDGSAVVKNSNGDTWIGDVTGDVRVNAANGKIIVERADAGVAARTANGDIRLSGVSRGAVLAQTARGRIDVGVHDGVAAFLDLHTRFGGVQSDLDPADRPEAGDDAVEVRARTSFGNITIHRAV